MTGEPIDPMSGLCTAKASIQKGHTAFRASKAAKTQEEEEKKHTTPQTAPVSVNASEILPTEYLRIKLII